MNFRLLVLDDDVPVRAVARLKETGIGLEIVKLELDEVFDGRYYRISSRGVELARQAQEFDAVMIGNNEGTGLNYAHVIPEQMKARTIVLWNRYEPGVEGGYAALGFTNFANRNRDPDATDWLLQLALEATIQV